MDEIELISKRKAREKHFLKEDGMIVANVYNEDIHFLKDGKYEEIDNSLIEAGDYLTNKNNAYKVLFNKVSNDGIMMMKNGEHYLKVSVDDCNKTLLKEVSSESKLYKSVLYEQIIDNVDLEYNVLPTKVKEVIILRNNQIKFDKLGFRIETDLALETNNHVIEARLNDETLFAVEAPYMSDSAGKRNNNIYYELTRLEDNEYLLKLVLDENWLTDESVVYPVVVDPTITNSGQNNSVYDTYIYPGDTNVNRNGKDILKVGVEKVNGTDCINRALIKFDLPTIGTGSQVIDASINIYGYPEAPYNLESDMLTVHQITANWNETDANWIGMNDKYNPLVEGIIEARRGSYDFENETIIPAYCGAHITRLVRRWYTGTPNYGLMLKQNEEKYNPKILPIFYSKDNHAIGSNPKPVLVITYRNQNGLEDYLSYETKQFSFGSAYFNSYNGNLTTMFDVGSTIGGKFPVSLNLFYNTNDVVLNNNDGYGLGYRLSLHQTIREQLINGKTYLEYTDEDGTMHYFLNQKTSFDEDGFTVTDTGNTYYDEDGLNMSITRQEDGYILKDKNGNTMKFIKKNNVGYLSEITDVSDNKIIITYNDSNLITKIKDANDEEIIINYHGDVITITSPNETVTLTYLNNKLESITSLLGVIRFTYNENNLISRITDVDGVKTNYDYYEQSPYKIKKVSECGALNTLGEFYDVLYGLDSTTITDSKKRAKTIIFNSQGGVVSISNLKEKDDINNAYGMSEINGTSEYGLNQGDNNKLLHSEIPLKYVKNLLSNTSFENSEINFTGTTDVTLSITDEEAATGKKSLKAVSTTKNQVITQTVSLPKGNYYTFSTFVKNNNKVIIALDYADENGMKIESKSKVITSNNEFERHDVTINYSNSAASDLNIRIYFEDGGSAYFDDVQLETGEVANNYNLLENSDFSEGFNDWNLSVGSVTTGEDLSPDGKFELVTLKNNVKALKTKLNPAYSYGMEKVFNISGKGGDVFNISFWYKNEGVNSDLSAYYGSRVYVLFNYVNQDDGHCVLPSPLLNTNDEVWQYVSNDFTAEKDYDSIKLAIYHEYTANNFYLTNLSLFKDIRDVYYEYDENGNVILQSDLDNEVKEFNYDKNNQLIKMVNPKGKHFMFEYDNLVTDRIINTISDLGIANQIKYDENGNPILTRMIKNNLVGDTLEGKYKIRLKGTNKYLRYINNEVKIVNTSCVNDLWSFDKVDEYFKISHSIASDKCFTSNDSNLFLTNFDGDNSLFTLIKNSNGSYKIKVKNKDKYLKFNDDILMVTDLVNDDYQHEFYLETNDDDLFMENSATYTDDGKVIKSTTDTLDNITVYDIDSATGLTNSVKDAKGNLTSYKYDDKRRLTSVTSGNKSVTYVYDDKNLLSKIKHGKKEYNFDYDEFSNIKTIKIGDNLTLVTNHYDESGDLTSFDYGNKDSVFYEYDEFYRLKKMTKESDTYNYKYNNNGDLVKILSNDDVIKYTYDLSKRLSEYHFNDFNTKYKYDANENIINVKYNLNNISSEVNNTYNKDDLVTIMSFDDNIINYDYDSLGRIKSRKINNTLDTNYEYLTNGNKTSLLVDKIRNDDDTYSYRYDELNNITHVYHNNTLENKYYYDDYNQLIEEKDYRLNKHIKYVYDNVGNLLFKNTYDLGDYNLLKQDKYEYDNDAWEDQLTKFNNDDITYDEIGNPLTIGNDVQLTWYNGRELRTYRDNENLINYKYNVDGIRVSKTINGVETKYYLEENDVIFEKNGSDVLYYIRSKMDDLLGVKYNDDVYYYIKNAQGDIIGMLDSSYNVVARYKYDSWGRIISTTDGQGNDVSNNIMHIANINPYRYRGYYYDKETKLYYLNERYYNPTWGRFINSDSYGGEIGGNILFYNIYSYSLNNPISNYDVSGQFAAAVGSSLIGGALSAIALATAGIFAKKLAQGISAMARSVVGNMGKTFAKSKTKAKTSAKTKAKTKSPNSSKHEEKPCVVAYAVDKAVLITNIRLTIKESQGYVISNGSVMCDTRSSAKKVAKGVTNKPIYHANINFGTGMFDTGMYPHYHIENEYGHGHIWFYPTLNMPISKEAD